MLIMILGMFVGSMFLESHAGVVSSKYINDSFDDGLNEENWQIIGDPTETIGFAGDAGTLRYVDVAGAEEVMVTTDPLTAGDGVTGYSVEFDFEYRPIASKWSFRGYGSLGNWKYDGETPYTLQNDDTGDFITSDGNVNLTGVKIGNAPQTSFGFGVRAQILKGLTVDMDYNIYTDLYEFVDVEEVATAALAGNQYSSVRLPAYTLADAGLTYNFDLGSNKMTFRANVYNLFNADYINQRDAFGYYLGIGRTFNASLRYNF